MYLPKLAEVSEKDALYAIGWLAKEGKITAKKGLFGFDLIDDDGGEDNDAFDDVYHL